MTQDTGNIKTHYWVQATYTNNKHDGYALLYSNYTDDADRYHSGKQLLKLEFKHFHPRLALHLADTLRDILNNDLHLTFSEIARYAPYDKHDYFKIGFKDYQAGHRDNEPDPNDGMFKGVLNQAYDRGAECAMKRQQALQRTLTPKTDNDEYPG